MEITLDLEELRQLVFDKKLEKDGATILIVPAGQNTTLATGISQSNSSRDTSSPGAIVTEG